MKIIITSEGDLLQSGFDSRFGRCAWFCLYDTETRFTEFLKNEHSQANGGAGTKTAEMVAELGAERIISGDFGPKAKNVLDQLKIQMVIPDNSACTVEEVIERLENGLRKQ